MLLTKRILSAVQLLLTAVIALTPFVLSPVCGPMPNGHYMACHDSAILVTVGGGILLLFALLQLLLSGKRPLMLSLSVLQVAAAFLLYAIPHRIIPISFRTKMDGSALMAGICAKDGMACVHTFALLNWLLAAVALIALILLGLVVSGRRDA